MAPPATRQRDEHHGFDRPSKRGTRPRTKQRPTHDNAHLGTVISVDRGRYSLAVAEAESHTLATTEKPEGSGQDQVAGPRYRTVIAMKARELRDRIVVGDRVAIVGDVSGDPDALARIVRIEPRTSVLRRTADDSDPYERIVVANADQLVIVAACANPEPRIGMIDRAVIAAYDAGMTVTLVLTKADLASPVPLAQLYEPAGVQVIATEPAQHDDNPQMRIGLGNSHQGNPGISERNTDPTKYHGDHLKRSGSQEYHRGSLTVSGASLALVRAALRGKVSVLLGHSGVGKSTLVNALVPGADRATGYVNETTGRGRQTSTSVVALQLPDGSGWVIDTPGIRSLGLAHVETEHVIAAFPDLAAVAEAECPRGCTHLSTAPDCALDEWVSSDPAMQADRELRLESLRRLLSSRAAAADALALHASQIARRSQ